MFVQVSEGNRELSEFGNAENPKRKFFLPLFLSVRKHSLSNDHFKNTGMLWTAVHMGADGKELHLLSHTNTVQMIFTIIVYI